MNLVYIVDFPVTGNSGKQKATREKAKALARNSSIDQFIFISDKPRKHIFSKIIGKVIFDCKTVIKLLQLKDFIVVQRVFFLPLTRCLLALKKVKVISEYHADLTEEIPLLNKPAYQKVLLKMSLYFFNLNYQISYGIIYNHPYLKAKFDPIYQKPSIFSYNGANFNDYYPINVSDARRQLQIPEDIIIFLFLGSVSKWHGVDYLITLFNQDKIHKKENIWLYIVGAKDNHYTMELKNRAKNKNIKFVEPVKTEIANLFINASNFCLLPVKKIRTSPGSPIKLYDYISCGKPVIAQESLMGYADEVENYNLGYTVDFMNSVSCIKQLILILEQFSDEDRLKYLKSNRAAAENELSWSSRMAKWCAFIEFIYYSK